jgi:hypothetical protein
MRELGDGTDPPAARRWSTPLLPRDRRNWITGCDGSANRPSCWHGPSTSLYGLISRLGQVLRSLFVSKLTTEKGKTDFPSTSPITLDVLLLATRKSSFWYRTLLCRLWLNNLKFYSTSTPTTIVPDSEAP